MKLYSTIRQQNVGERLASCSQEELLNGIRTRDKAVLKYLNKVFISTIHLLISRMKDNAADAKDIFQDAIIDLIKMAEDSSFVLTSIFKTLLYSVCKNLGCTGQGKVKESFHSTPINKMRLYFLILRRNMT